MIKEKW